MRFRTRACRMIFAIALFTAFGAESAAAAAPSSGPAARDRGDCTSHADAIERAAPSVVHVRVLRAINPRRREPLPFPDFLMPAASEGEPSAQWERSSGSAVVIFGGGVMLTNNHVVEDAVELEIISPDGVRVPAELLGADRATDIAVIRARDGFERLTPIEMGDSGGVRVGDVVFAIGNPFGIGQTVTAGIVSARDRTGIGLLDVEEFIQTDAAINPGSSGGALIDADGELIGISTALVSWTGGGQGIGFAVPIELAKSIANAILVRGQVERGWLGATLQDLTPSLARTLEIESAAGVLITGVAAGGPAASAGLLPEDVITAIDAAPAASASKVGNTLAKLRPGKTLRLEIERRGEHRVVKLVLAERPARRTDQIIQETGEAQPLGIQLTRMDDVWRAIYGIPEDVREGLIVTAVEAGGAAALGGLLPGDVVQEIDRRRIADPAMLRRAWMDSERGLLIRAVRRGRPIYLVLERVEPRATFGAPRVTAW